MHAYIIVCVFVPVHVHVCVFKWKPEDISGLFISHFPAYFWGQSCSLNLVRLAAQQTLGILLSLLPYYWNYMNVRLHVVSGNWTWVLTLLCQAFYQLSSLSICSQYIFLLLLSHAISLHLISGGMTSHETFIFLGFSCMLPMAGIMNVHWYVWVLHDFEDSFCRYDKRALHIWI